MARQVLAAHREGVISGALAYVRIITPSARNGGSGEDRRRSCLTTGLLAASFTHGVNRNLDPHLHTHVVMANMVHGVDGRWSAIRPSRVFRRTEMPQRRQSMRPTCGESLTARLGLRWVAGPGSRSRRGRASPPSCWGSSHPDRPTSGGTWPNMVPIPPAAHTSPGPPPDRKSSRGSTSEKLSPSSGSDEPVSRGTPTVGAGGLLGQREAKTVRRSSTSIDSAPRCHWLRTAQPAVGTSWPPSDGGAGGAPATEHRAAHRSVDAVDLQIELRSGWPRMSTRCAASSREHICSVRSSPRPVNQADHEVWRDAAHAIDDYRRRWNVTRATEALGVDSRRFGDLVPADRRLVEHLRTVRQVELARQRLGWRATRQHELDRGR